MAIMESGHFKISLFQKTRIFTYGDCSILVENEGDMVRLYGSNGLISQLYCVIPLCHPKYLRKGTFYVAFTDDERALLSIGEFKLVVDFARRKCANNGTLVACGSELWGEDCSAPWDAELEAMFV